MKWEKLSRFEIRKIISERRLLLEEDEVPAKKEVDYSLNTNIKTQEQDTLFRFWVKSKTNQDGKLGQDYVSAIEKILDDAGLGKKKKLSTKTKKLRNKYVQAVWNSKTYTFATDKGEKKTKTIDTK